MHLISVSVSPKQLSKLRNGHKVRVKKGSGVSLVVHPNTYNIVSRAFRKSKGAEIQLSPDELQANISLSPESHAQMASEADSDLFPEIAGSGLYAGGKIRIPKALKKLGRQIQHGLKDFGHDAKKGLQQANKFLKGNPITKAIIKDVAPEIANVVGTAGATYLTGNPMVGKITGKLLQSGAKAGLKSQGYGLYAGAGLSAIKRQNLGTAHSLAEHAAFDDMSIHARHNADPIRSYYSVSEFPNAPPSRGTGLRRHRSVHDLNLITGRGANISQVSGHQIQALTPQPYGENFQMQHFLPPQYQKYNRGTTMPK